MYVGVIDLLIFDSSVLNVWTNSVPMQRKKNCNNNYVSLFSYAANNPFTMTNF